MENRQTESSFDPKAFLSKGGEGRTILRFRQAEVIYRQGDPAASVFYIRAGEAKLSVTSERGKEAVVAVLGPGDFFGEACLRGEGLRQTTATALTECAITCITRAETRRVIHEEPAFAEVFILHLLDRNSHFEEDLIDQLFNSSEKRLARMLLLLANFGGEGDPEPVLARISQETLAEMVGTTRSRINFFMNKFRRMGLIDYNHKIHVHRALLDMVLHEEPEIKKANKK